MVSDTERRKRWKKMTLRLTQGEYDEIAAAAAAANMTLSDFVLHLVRNPAPVNQAVEVITY